VRLPPPSRRAFRRGRVTPLLAALAACALGLALVFAGSVPASAAAPVPVDYNFIDGVTASFANPAAAPPGANNWSCAPTARHPYPVVLVNGTGENMANGFSAISPLLVNNGYCVFAANFGGTPGSLTQGTGDIAQSAAQLSTFVDQVLATTGAARVDLVGHSQGGMMPRYYLKFLGGASKVADLVGLSPSNHGTTVDGLAALPGVPALLTAGLGASVADQIAGSPFLQHLNAGGDTVPGVSYTVITTTYDEVVTPYTSAFLAGPDVTDITVQQQCPLDVSDHLGISFDANALRDVLNALDPAHAKAPTCTATLPINGG
jgi:triacylglycerol esterase/lipase EstA (alpha/beta hydrolase family)